MEHVVFQSTLQTPKLVVALDIGSTYSGYAWQWRRDGEATLHNVEFNTNWGVGSLQLLKTSTSLLLKASDRQGEYEVDSIGYLAEKRYCNYMMEQEERGDDNQLPAHYLFKQFKLVLYYQTCTDGMKIDAVCGTHFSFKLVMSKFIGALKDNFLAKMADKNQTVDLRSTLWVITVPAIWSDSARGFMQEAAIEAGINKFNILLALEPEVASIYCLHQSPQRDAFGDKGKFVTVDLGGCEACSRRCTEPVMCCFTGGTVDITAFEVMGDGLIKHLNEVCQGCGSCVGGQQINDAFTQKWKDAFDLKDWSEIRRKITDEDMLQMELDFERNKVEIGSSEADEHINLAIPDSTKEMIKERKIRLKDSEEVRTFFKIEKGKFMFSPNTVREELFKVTIASVVDTIKEVLDKPELKDVETLVLTGGFSESKIVTDEIRRNLRENEKYSRINIITLTSPFRAVLSGAVLFGHNPRVFRSRISRKTYGVRTSELFDPKVHDPAMKYVDPVDGESYIRGVFSVHVRKDESVCLNEEHSCLIYHPKREDAKKVRIRIYSSNDRNPKFVTDAGCRQEGEIVINLPETSQNYEREIVVRMIYGGTQLDVIVTDGSTENPRQYDATIKFR